MSTAAFLKADTDYRAEIYANADNADWQNNPLAIDIRRQVVNNNGEWEISGKSGVRRTPIPEALGQ